jgi:hypothetical protein
MCKARVPSYSSRNHRLHRRGSDVVNGSEFKSEANVAQREGFDDLLFV